MVLKILYANNWKDYELIDASGGEKLERWGKYILRRPDSQALGNKQEWEIPDAEYIQISRNKGHWKYNKSLPENWVIEYPLSCGILKLAVEPLDNKHTGVFPEQAVNWEFIANTIGSAPDKNRPIRILNLFAYTGATSAACLMAGADELVHVDASKAMNERAKNNLIHSGVRDENIRFITEDVNKFVDREIRRGRKYEGIIMDPPAYGRGPRGELWKIEDAIYEMIRKCEKLLSDNPLFFIVNVYTEGYTPLVIKKILNSELTSKRGGDVFAYNLNLQATARNLYLPCGTTARWRPYERK